MTPENGNVSALDKDKNKLSTKINTPIKEFELSECQKGTLHDHSIKFAYNFFQNGYTADQLSEHFGDELVREVNWNLNELGFESLAKTKTNISDHPEGFLYTLFKASVYMELLYVYPEVLGILIDVEYGNISPESKAKDIDDPSLGREMTAEDVELIINVSKFIIDIDAQKRADSDAFFAITHAYPNLRLEIADLNLRQYQIDAFARKGLHSVYHLYEYQVTSEQLIHEFPTRKDQKKPLAESINDELRQLGLFPVAEGDKPIGPFYALYRASEFHRIPGTFSRVIN